MVQHLCERLGSAGTFKHGDIQAFSGLESLWAAKWLQPELELKNKPVISPAAGSTHGLGDPDILSVFPSHDVIIYHLPVFGSQMHQSCFVQIRQAKDNAVNKIVGSTEPQKEMAIAVAFSDTMFTNDTLPGIQVSAHSSTEFSQNDELVSVWDSCYYRVKIFVEFILDFIWIFDGGSIYADESCKFLSSNG